MSILNFKLTDNGDNGEIMGLVVRLATRAKRSEQENVTILRHFMEETSASARIVRKYHATLEFVRVTQPQN